MAKRDHIRDGRLARHKLSFRLVKLSWGKCAYRLVGKRSRALEIVTAKLVVQRRQNRSTGLTEFTRLTDSGNARRFKGTA